MVAVVTAGLVLMIFVGRMTDQKGLVAHSCWHRGLDTDDMVPGYLALMRPTVH